MLTRPQHVDPDMNAGNAAGVGRSLRERFMDLRDRLVLKPAFRQWAARFFLTRPIARQQSAFHQEPDHTDPPGLGATISFFQDPPFALGRERAAFRLGHDLWIGNVGWCAMKSHRSISSAPVLYTDFWSRVVSLVLAQRGTAPSQKLPTTFSQREADQAAPYSHSSRCCHHNDRLPV